MSSTLTSFQAPAHTAVHMYTHPEMEPQQPYSSNGFISYLMDSRFPEDADAYSAHSESRYDEARYSHLPPGPVFSEFEDAQIVFRYGRTMQDEDMTPPQLLCPRPTLPLSRFAHHSSWSDRPSEAPINAYRAYSEPSSNQQPTSFIPRVHSPQAGEKQYSFENHRALVSTPEFYPAAQEFVETDPHSISTFHHGEALVKYTHCVREGDSVYPQQSLLVSTASFQAEQDPTQSNLPTNIPYYAAHQPIPPEKRSSYSELAPNLSFMNNQPPLVPQETIHVQDRYIAKDDAPTRTCTTPSLDIKKNPYALGLNGPPLTSIGRKMPLPVPSDHTVVDTTAVPVPSKPKSSRSVNEPRRPSLACTFCRERKIACGRPPDGSADLTCKVSDRGSSVRVNSGTILMNNHNIILTSPKEIVHLEYTPTTLSPRPSDEWTRFVCISDSHSRTFHVPDGDVLLHSGDLTNMGTVKDFQKTMEWLYHLPHKTKIIIAGNHDLPLHSGWYDTQYIGWHRKAGKQDIKAIMEMLKGPRAVEAGIVYLQDEAYEFRTKENGKLWNVYGSPWSPKFFNWAFNYERENGEELVSKFPKTDILLTHGPAYQIFDRTGRHEDVGCEALRARLSDIRPRLHLAGHIHEAHGAHIHAWDTTAEPPSVQSGENILNENIQDPNLDHTVFVNAANWPSGERMQRDISGMVKFGGPGFRPVVVDLKE